MPVSQINQPGTLFVVAAPSGAGKSTLVNALLTNDPNIMLSVSYTTREPRTGETNGESYHFTTVSDFLERQSRGEFIESAEVHGNYYGTSKAWIHNALESGKDVLLEIDWQGAQQVRHFFPQMTGIFILPPSLTALRERLYKRGTDSEEVITRRLLAAGNEMAHAPNFEYVIINENLDSALADLTHVVKAARLRFAQQFSRRPSLFYDLGIHAQ
ncbi:guanylate kinase [Formosimonas limnophila]|uniref:Guanylate kinase n=1 Tax=Formosimonas limnophila TaxID=1384487 RepID=A0A8J3CH81_9BURK|nr:guanylate kinase [Formosimonas limnophila]GHA71106.1 guanylate kinase [Formosimonas limnophila]